MSVGGGVAIGLVIGIIIGGLGTFFKYGVLARKVDELEAALAKAVKELKDIVK